MLSQVVPDQFSPDNECKTFLHLRLEIVSTRTTGRFGSRIQMTEKSRTILRK